MGSIRALVVGAGETSTLMHLPVLARLRSRGRLELVEICDLRRERAAAAAQQFGFDRHSGDALSPLARSDISAVYLFGDARLHHDLGLRALEAGKHLFVEKPVAPSHIEAEALARMARERRLIAVGGHNRRFYRSLEEIRRRGGRAGWRYAEATFHKPAQGSPPPFGARSWLTANGIHALDALIWIMGGLPEHLTAIASAGDFSALMRWPGGAQGAFLCDNHAGERREAYAFHAPGLSCRADDGGLRITANGASTFTEFAGVGDGFEAEHIAFLDAIDKGVEPRHSLSAIAPSLKLAELIEEGFDGPVDWPGKSPARIVPMPRRPAEGSMLVVNAGGLKTVLAANPSGRPLVALEDVARSSRARPEIVAALIGAGPSAISAEVLDRLPNLRAAGLVGLSLARHEPERLLGRGVALINASEAYAESVAEFAFGLAVLARRRAFVSDQVMRKGGWGSSPQPQGWKSLALQAAQALRPMLANAGLEPALLKLWRETQSLHHIEVPPASRTRELRGATAGLIGWGANARAFAIRLLAAGAKVCVYSEHAPPDDIAAAGASPGSLAEALAADIVSLHRGLTPDTRHFLGAEELARLRPGSVLINVARADLIDPDALIDRLRKDDVFACLDVFETEPPPARHPLRRMPNVFLTSHIAGGSADMQAAATREVLDKIERCLGGGAAPAVTRERLRTMT